MEKVIEVVRDPLIDHDRLLLEPATARRQSLHQRRRATQIHVCGPLSLQRPQRNLEEPFSSFGVWQHQHEYNDNLRSLRPAIAHVVLQMLYTCNAFATAISEVVEFPPDIAPGYHLYIRTPHGGAMARAQNALRGTPAWWDDDEQLRQEMLAAGARTAFGSRT